VTLALADLKLTGHQSILSTMMAGLIPASQSILSSLQTFPSRKVDCLPWFCDLLCTPDNMVSESIQVGATFAFVFNWITH
jgi:hypothetical protein